jgi:hypothetical protein
MQQYSNRSLPLLLLLCLTIISPSVFAIKISIDYSLDNHGFFDQNTEQGYQARQTLESVAHYFSELLTDQFTAISPIDNNSFTSVFQHPSDTNFVEIPQMRIPDDTLVIFVGARDLDGSLLGYAGVGGYSAQGHSDFLNSIVSRGQNGIIHGDFANEFAPWGGYLSFDLYTDWYFDDDISTNDVPAQQFDFYSNALHEFGHLLGIGTSDSWFRQTAYSYFDGEHTGLYYNDLIPLDETLEHWAQDVEDIVDGFNQSAALTPALKPGERKLFTQLDIAALKDIGWEINNLVQVAGTSTHQLRTPDDFNQDGHSDLIWRNPTTGQLSITYLNWQQTDAGLHAETVEQVKWISVDDTNWKLIAIEYLDADSHPDLLWWHQQTGEIGIWYMDQAEIKAIASPFNNRAVNSWKPVDVKDFNGDGSADIIWWNQQLSKAEIWYINQWGTDNTQVSDISQTFQSEQPNDTLIGSADFDANGTPDLIFINNDTGNYTLWSLDQQTLIAVDPLGWSLDNTTHLVATKDYNRDGIPDLLLQADSPDNQQTTVLTLLTLENLTTAKSQTDLRFAIPSTEVDSIN